MTRPPAPRPVRRLAAAVAALALAAAHASPAGAQFARTGAGTTAGFDDNWSVRWFGIAAASRGQGGTLANAAIVTSPPSPPWAPNVPGVQQWIGVSAGATVPSPAPSAGTASYRYFFQTTYNQLAAGTISFGIGWDNVLVGAFVGNVAIAADGAFDASGATALLPGVTPGTPFLGGLSGFCRNGDGAFPGGQFPNCVYNLALAAPAGSAQTLTFILQGDGTTDAFFAGAPTGANTPTPVVPGVVPEPATVALTAAGLAVLGAAARRRRTA